MVFFLFGGFEFKNKIKMEQLSIVYCKMHVFSELQSHPHNEISTPNSKTIHYSYTFPYLHVILHVRQYTIPIHFHTEL